MHYRRFIHNLTCTTLYSNGVGAWRLQGGPNRAYYYYYNLRISHFLIASLNCLNISLPLYTRVLLQMIPGYGCCNRCCSYLSSGTSRIWGFIIWILRRGIGHLPPPISICIWSFDVSRHLGIFDLLLLFLHQGLFSITCGSRS